MQFENNIFFLDLLWYDVKNVRGIGKMSFSYAIGICNKIEEKNLIIIFIKNNESKTSILEKIKNYKEEKIIFYIVKNPLTFYLFEFANYFITFNKTKLNYKKYYFAFGSFVPFLINKKIKVINFYHDFVWFDTLFSIKKMSSFKREYAYSVVLFINHLLKSRPLLDCFISDDVQRTFPQILNHTKAYYSDIFLNPVEINENYLDLQKDINSIVYIGPKRDVKNFKALKFVIEKFESNKVEVIFKLINISINELDLELKIKHVNIIEYGLLEDDQVQKVISKSHSIFIPSLSESFSYPAFYAHLYKTVIVGTNNSPFKKYLTESLIPINPLDLNDCYFKLEHSLKINLINPPLINNTIECQTQKLISLINTNVPIVIFHNGKQKYFDYALTELTKRNYIVFVIGNIKPYNKNINFFHIDEFSSNINTEFSDNYIHMSTNGYKNEYNCFLRWFYIQDLVKKYKINSFWHIDSDVLVLDDFYDYKLKVEKLGQTAISTPTQNHKFQLSSSAHVSYWLTSDLKDYTNFIINSYKYKNIILQKKWEYHLDNNVNGGVCDMTLLFLWQSSNSKIIDISTIKLPYHYNDNLNEIINGKIFLRKLKIDTYQLTDCSTNFIVPFLHCQGQAKYFLYLKIYFGYRNAYALTKLIYKIKYLLK